MLKYQDKKQFKKNKKTTNKIIFLFLFFVISASGLMGALGGPLNFISRPILKTGEWISDGFSNMGYYFNTKKTLARENEALLEDNLALKTKLETFEIIEKENLELKEILNRVVSPENFVLANILTKPNRSIYDTVILDVGVDAGVKEGDLAYAYGEVPVGKITQVYSNTSLLTLYSSPLQKTEGYIDGVNASVELVGRGGGNFESIIPIELNLAQDTLIYLPHISSQVLARVVEVISSPSDPFKKVILSSPVNIESLKWVQVKIK